MNDKQKILQFLEDIDDSETFENIMQELYEHYKIEKGLQNVEEGKYISTEEVLKKLEEW